MDSKVIAVIGRMERVIGQYGGAKAGPAAWDRLRLVEILEAYYKICTEEKRLDDFTCAFAAYCGMYIRGGFQAQLGNWDFSEFGSWFDVEGVRGEFYRCLWLGIRDRSDHWFEMALERWPESAVTALYLFVRKAAVLSRELAEGVPQEQGEGEMWRYFELLPMDYREYVLGTGKDCGGVGAWNRGLEQVRRWLPYILFSLEPGGEERSDDGSWAFPVCFDSRAARGLFLGRFHMFCEGRRLRGRISRLEDQKFER